MAIKNNIEVKEGLQKFTDSKKKISKLFKLDRITDDDIKQLSQDEHKLFNDIVNDQMKKASAIERDKILRKIEDTLSDDTKNDFWEYNHNRIMATISSLMKEYGRMPSRSEIAQKAELSRTTVYKHLKEYTTHPLYIEQLQKMRIMAINVLSKVCQAAMAGDVGSQKLYLNVMGFLPNTQVTTMNNYIQVNNTIVSQETIRHLSPDQLFFFETILKSIIPQAEAKAIDETEKKEGK